MALSWSYLSHLIQLTLSYGTRTDKITQQFPWLARPVSGSPEIVVEVDANIYIGAVDVFSNTNFAL